MIGTLAQAAPNAAGNSYLTQIGVAGILVMLILQVVFKFVKEMKDKKNGNGNGNKASDTGQLAALGILTPQNISDIFKGLGDIKATVNDLHQWHDVRDEDHVFAWYIRKSLSDNICELKVILGKVAKGIEKQNELLKSLCEEE